MWSRSSLSMMGWVLCLGCVTLTGRADEFAERGRVVLKENQGTVVAVALTLKITAPGMRGGPRQAAESRQDILGTVIDSAGLTVVSLSATDPAQMLESLGQQGDAKSRVESELIDVKLLVDGGTELPAEMVARDPELDLAFIRPKTKPSAPLAAVDLTKTGKVRVLDQVIALNRLGSAAGRAASASAERISAIVEKPRLFYVPETGMTSTALGAPAFTLTGDLLGIFVMRASKGRAGAGGVTVQGGNVMGIIIPAEDVLKASKQIPPEAEKKDK